MAQDEIRGIRGGWAIATTIAVPTSAASSPRRHSTTRPARLAYLTAPVGAHCQSPALAARGQFRPESAATRLSEWYAKRQAKGLDVASIERRMTKQLCIVKATTPTGPVMTPNASTHNDIGVPTPDIYFDHQAGYYYSISDWNWHNYTWETCGNWCEANDGPPDAFGTAMSKALVMTGWSITYCGLPNSNPMTNGYGCKNDKVADTGNKYGALFKEQDKDTSIEDPRARSIVDDYNMDTGTEVMTFYSDSGCKSVYAVSKYGHTWSSDSINSIGIGDTSVSIGFQSDDHALNASSQPGPAASVCGQH